ncbi:MAG TPA: PEP/pyruvate-binding domain-containing protein, partial [Candidatus Paceibacterota bacterium]|nr:PEP/pyruvate-binding domain-containing protein [Candidatus Paceibacterota bacterium]
MVEKKEDSKNKKDENNKSDFIKWFSELNKTSGNIAGGKGANLAEMYNMKIPVPPGFVVTAQAYDYFIKKAGLDEKIKQLLEKIKYEDTEQLNKITEEIRNLIVNAKFPKEIEEEILESYENLDVKQTDFENETVLGILKSSSESIFVAVRSSATTEDLAEASFAGQQDTFLNVKGKTELLESVKKCFASLFTARATYYRNKKGFKHEQASLAVVIQKMINADKSGVIFSKDPTYKNENMIIEAVWGLGEGIVSGQITPDRYIVSKEDSDLKILDKKISNKKIAITRDSGGKKEIIKLVKEKANSPVLKDYQTKKLAEFAIKLEEHYQKPQDIEFAIEGEEIYIVQTRPITTIEKRIEKTTELEGEIILKGLAASPGIASGKIKIIENLEDLKHITTGDILVTKMTNPDMVVSMQKSAAIVTDEGGLTAHAAIVSREMGIPAIVGTQEATTKLKEGEIITVNGFTGNIYKGKISETIQKEVLPVTAKTKTKIKVIVDLPT